MLRRPETTRVVLRAVVPLKARWLPPLSELAQRVQRRDFRELTRIVLELKRKLVAPQRRPWVRLP